MWVRSRAQSSWCARFYARGGYCAMGALERCGRERCDGEALQHQQPQLGGTIIPLLATLTVVGALISDLLQVVVDPRIRLTGQAR